MMMTVDWVIRTMRRDDLAFAAACTQGEDWASEDLTTLQGFHIVDPAGCLVAEVCGELAGICIATYYGTSGFIGELIVRPEQRGLGLGAALLNEGVRRLQQRGARTVYLDGVLKAVGMYERNGFCKITRSWRFAGQLAGQTHPQVVPMQAHHLPAVFALDQRAFGADRRFFLGRRWSLFPELGQVLVQDGQVSGYILGRRGPGWLSAGPWVVEDGVAQSEHLLLSLALEAGDTQISIGILDVNRRACGLVESLGFTPRLTSPWRMALGPDEDLGASPLCYAVGSAAKG
jgi:ribosomal protein S18 acetylase RimI-like enzyme